MNVPTNVERWRSLAEKYCAIYMNLLPNEILSEIQSESSGDPAAYNPTDPSWGLLGVSPLIARSFGGFDILDISWHVDPDKNVKCGSAFLSYLKRKYVDKHPIMLLNGEPNPFGWPAAYNQGETQFLRGIPDLAYVTAFVNHLQAFQEAAQGTDSALGRGE